MIGISAILRTAVANRCSLSAAANALEIEAESVGVNLTISIGEVIAAIRARQAARKPNDAAGAYWDQCQRAAEDFR